MHKVAPTDEKEMLEEKLNFLFSKITRKIELNFDKEQIINEIENHNFRKTLKITSENSTFREIISDKDEKYFFIRGRDDKNEISIYSIWVIDKNKWLNEGLEEEAFNTIKPNFPPMCFIADSNYLYVGTTKEYTTGYVKKYQTDDFFKNGNEAKSEDFQLIDDFVYKIIFSQHDDDIMITMNYKVLRIWSRNKVFENKNTKDFKFEIKKFEKIGDAQFYDDKHLLVSDDRQLLIYTFKSFKDDRLLLEGKRAIKFYYTINDLASYGNAIIVKESWRMSIYKADQLLKSECEPVKVFDKREGINKVEWNDKFFLDYKGDYVYLWKIDKFTDFEDDNYTPFIMGNDNSIYHLGNDHLFSINNGQITTLDTSKLARINKDCLSHASKKLKFKVIEVSKYQKNTVYAEFFKEERACLMLGEFYFEEGKEPVLKREFITIEKPLLLLMIKILYTLGLEKILKI